MQNVRSLYLHSNPQHLRSGSCNDWTLQIFKVPSALAEDSHLPQAEKSREWIAFACPLKIRQTRPCAISHTSTALSSPALANHRPHGEKANACSGDIWPVMILRARWR
jgi:hypothetical protein